MMLYSGLELGSGSRPEHGLITFALSVSLREPVLKRCDNGLRVNFAIPCIGPNWVVRMR